MGQSLSPLEVSSSSEEEMEIERLSGVFIWGQDGDGMVGWLVDWFTGCESHVLHRYRHPQRTTSQDQRPLKTYIGRSHKVSRATSYLGH